jgi:hypothetical protein
MVSKRTIVAVAINKAAETFVDQFGVSKGAARAWCTEALECEAVQIAIVGAAQQVALQSLNLIIPRGAPSEKR